MMPSPTGQEECPTSSEAPPEILPAAWVGPGAPPLEIDIGCHKGLFLAEMARLHPERNFLGIERQRERVERTRRKIHALGLANADVVQAEGFEALAGVGPACVDYIHVLFPDPWPKRRHHSRRLVQKAFLDRCAAILKPGGMLRLVTDDEPYAKSMREVSLDAAELKPEAEEDRPYPLTEFQKKFIADGRPFYTLLLRRAAS